MADKFFIFDLDNTLVKTNRANNESYRDAILAIIGKSVEISKKRFTRNDLAEILPNLTEHQVAEIVKEKENCYNKHLSENILNTTLCQILVLLREEGCETILLTESNKTRALSVCEYFSLTQYFKKQYFKNDYPKGDKYLFLKQINIPMCRVVLFENEKKEIRRAIQNGIPEKQIIQVKF